MMMSKITHMMRK